MRWFREGRAVALLRSIIFYAGRRAGSILPDRTWLAIVYRMYFGVWPDYDNPKTFNEHIQAYTLRSRDPLLPIVADKIAVRDYLTARVGSQYLVPVLGVWDCPAEVPLDTLQRPCVIKPTASSGMVAILRVGEQIDQAALRKRMGRWQRNDYSKLHREWFYAGLDNRLMAEVMLQGEKGELPADYKVYVIGGSVRFIQVDRGRFKQHTRNLYSTQWDLLPVRLTLENHGVDERPDCLSEMISIAEKLADEFEFLRVDYYWVNDKLYIGELTNTPGAGFETFIPNSYAVELGSYWVIGQKGKGPAKDLPHQSLG
jgi:hypothetical protein